MGLCNFVSHLTKISMPNFPEFWSNGTPGNIYSVLFSDNAKSIVLIMECNILGLVNVSK